MPQPDAIAWGTGKRRATTFVPSNPYGQLPVSFCRNVILILLMGVCTAGMSSRVLAQATPSDQISQVSVINALLLGQYQGTLPLKKLLLLGDFGLGTLDHLDGELIILDGVAWQARADGTVRRCEPEMTTPFAVITPFDGEETFDCPAVTSLEHLESMLDPRLPSRDAFVAVRVDATFDLISLRAVPRQEPPYRPLAEVVKNQAQWERKKITGTLIGIRSPAWVTGIGIPGFHWHFLSQDRLSGGHVFNCRFESASVTFDRCRTWMIQLGDSLETQGKNLNQDLSKELDQVERQRGTPSPTQSD
ncbi:MAG TPA: acetolactate decarboxylase [Planctomicrobium sp.]|nr:acetolactate decarboxylase [Planctomicrobium sp.]